ncbi:hypothetical protein F4778DRAFT_391894 [Xylariomycetidae sp. FL2044]|nr:hypothetical protein F4778DRAFT_391894 [Xylariomycetidae sp. FL2044]
MCDNKDGPFAPFCEPANGTTLRAGSSVDVTWDPSFFSDPETLIQLGGQLSPLSGETQSGQEGFVTEDLRAGDGRYTWEIADDAYLEDGQDMVLAALSLAVSNNSAAGGTEILIAGPQVQLTRAAATAAKPVVNPAAIAVPVVLGVLVLGLVTWYLVKRRRDPGFSLRSMVPGTGAAAASAGYGVKKSRGERTGPLPLGGRQIKMAPMMNDDAAGAAAAGAGRNVFRDELRRQQTGGMN